MSEWFTLQTFVAFLLGVALSAMVKSKLGAAKSAVGV
jgi:hypothetical protein